MIQAVNLTWSPNLFKPSSTDCVKNNVDFTVLKMLSYIFAEEHSTFNYHKKLYQETYQHIIKTLNKEEILLDLTRPMSNGKSNIRCEINETIV